MSNENTKTPHGTSRREEEQYLARTLAVVRDNIEKYGRDVSRMRAEIDDMLEHFHDDNPELINNLENTITMHDNMARALERNERAQGKPYFGRIDFHDETYDKDESLYIGRGGISSDATHLVVVDWRAPVSNAYYENGLGKCSYSSPDGSRIKIDLNLKRTYEIENGKLLNYFDSEVIANDDLLTKYLSRNKQAVLGEIVATIQKEQNEIIRRSPYHNCLVQGVAGSGKTTVAMHRISYILYNYAERFKPEDFYIVGSNRILLNYITGVLPGLDVYGVRQMTMEQLFVRLLYEDWDDKKYRIKNTGKSDGAAAVKGSLSWFKDLEDFCRRLEWQTIPRDSVYLNPKQFVEGIRNGKNGVYDETDGTDCKPENRVLLVDSSAVERYIRQNPSISIQSKIDMLNDRLTVKIKDEFLGKGVKYTEPEKKAILRAYRGRYGKNTWEKSIYTLYEDFLKKQITKGYTVEIPTDTFDVYDLAALAYLYKRVKETEVISEAHHVVIDEAQDFGMMAYSVLKFCIKDCTYTIMGDVSQNIHFGYGLNDWEDLKELYLQDPMASFNVLKKSYRNTVEISHFATRILHHGDFWIYPVEPIIRHGSNPEVLQLSDTDALYHKAAEVCRDWQKKGLETIAVICRDSSSAALVSEKLGKLIDIMESDLEKAEFGNGILVLPVEYTKGLEFDAVLILNPTRDEYPVDNGHAKLLYVAATRALHELCVLHTGNLTGLIADPVPQRQMGDLSGAEQKSTLQKSSAAAPKTEIRRPVPAQKPAAAQPVSAQRPVTAQTASERKPVTAQTASASRPVVSQAASGQRPVPEKSDKSDSFGYSFGDLPATEKLRPAGHPKIDLAVRWVSKQSDGLYLQSRYGVLRLSPIGGGIIRITFTKGGKILDGIHPRIAVNRTDRAWMYKDSSKTIGLLTDELCLQVDKASGSIRYLTRDKKLLLAERLKECRQVETAANGITRSFLYLDWQKNENIYSTGDGRQAGMNLRGAARYISAGGPDAKLPLLISDKGYGIVTASSGPVICCDISSYGSYISTEKEPQMDHYFIAGKKAETVFKAYAYLCGEL